MIFPELILERCTFLWYSKFAFLPQYSEFAFLPKEIFGFRWFKIREKQIYNTLLFCLFKYTRNGLREGIKSRQSKLTMLLFYSNSTITGNIEVMRAKDATVFM